MIELVLRKNKNIASIPYKKVVSILQIMKVLKLGLLAFFFLINAYTIAQNAIPVIATYAISKTNYKAGDTVEFIINLKINKGWYVYSSEFKADGPMKFECKVEMSKDFQILDKIIAWQPFEHYDEIWEGEVKIFEERAQFRLPMVMKKMGEISIKAVLTGQVCNEVCMPFKIQVDADLNKLPFCDYQAVDANVYKHYNLEKVK